MEKTLKTAMMAAAAAVVFASLAAPGAIKAEGAVPAILFMKITAYSSTPDQTDSTPFITADGLRVRDGIVATNLLPFGTQIEVPALFGNKIFTVEDRMSPRIKNTVDIWMSTRGAALYFGAHYANVLIFPGDGPPAAPVPPAAPTAPLAVTL